MARLFNNVPNMAKVFRFKRNKFVKNVLNIAKHKTISNIAIVVAKLAKIPFPIWLDSVPNTA